MQIKGRRWIVAAALVAAATVAGEAGAQVFTPTFMAPRSSSDLGVYFSDGPGEFALEGIMRRGNLGLRLGLADMDDAALLLGGELRHPLQAGTAPLDLAFTAALQGVIGDVDALGLQGGLSLGRTFVSEGLAITPYLLPRVAFYQAIGGPDDDFEADFLADLGVDIGISPNLILRAGFVFGDPAADVGIGLAWR